MKQLTIKNRIDALGIGLHKGNPIRITLEPLDTNSGIVFYRTDTNSYIEATPQNVVNTQMATVIAKDGFSISTIEHLLSSIYAYGIDNILIKVNSHEIPIMDGSSASFCMMLNEVGLVEQNALKKIMIIKKEIEVRDGKKFVRLSPSMFSQYIFSIDFTHPAIGFQKFIFNFSKDNYKQQIARARTFGFLKDLQMLQSKNLALGASLENAIVLDEKNIINSDGLRYDNEFVRHKILDAIGDLSLLGSAFIGKYESHAGSHKLNHLLTKELLKDKQNYEIKDLEGIKELTLSKVYA